jgi:S1-C subfamily serine protease
LSTPDSSAQTAVTRLSSALADTAGRIAPSVIQVFGRPRRSASGIVIAPERVLTTSHSVEWDEGLKVRTDAGELREATIVGHHHGADLVLLKVPGLDAAPLAFDSASPKMGELALLSGRSWRGEQRARLVMVSGVSGPIQMRDGTRLEHMLVLSISPYPGFSGSAVVAADGRLVGIATAGLFRGTAVALPGDLATSIVQEIEQHGGVRRGFLGVTSQPVRVPARQKGSSPRDRGLVILGVAENSPADRAGLLVGDIMVEAAGTSLDAPEDLLALLTSDRVGQSLELNVIRGGGMQNVTVTVGQRPHA